MQAGGERRGSRMRLPRPPRGPPNDERGFAASVDLERAGEEPGSARRRAEAKPEHRRSGGRELRARKQRGASVPPL